MPKRGENIRKRKDGRWEARYIASYSPLGKAIFKSVYGCKYAEVKAEKRKRERSIFETKQTETVSGSGKTVRSATAEFLCSAKPRVKESTYAHYAFLCERHIIPYFGDFRINRLNDSIINDFIFFKLKKGSLTGGSLSAKTVNDIVGIFIQILKKQGNASFQVERPSIKQPNVNVLSDREYHKLLANLLIDTNSKKLGLVIAMLTGIRQGELCALQWKDIDFHNEVIHITKTIQRIAVTDETDSRKTKIIIDTPKSDKSVRMIPIPSLLLKKLLDFKDDNEKYILTGGKSYIEPRNYQTFFKKMLKSYGLPDSNFHVLRHTFATTAVEKGMDIKTLSAILGHADVCFTMKMYVHPSMERKKDQMEKLIVNF